jgi:hypothetical protein
VCERVEDVKGADQAHVIVEDVNINRKSQQESGGNVNGHDGTMTREEYDKEMAERKHLTKMVNEIRIKDMEKEQEYSGVIYFG